jgi:hypothetical protein
MISMNYLSAIWDKTKQDSPLLLSLSAINLAYYVFIRGSYFDWKDLVAIHTGVVTLPYTLSTMYGGLPTDSPLLIGSSVSFFETFFVQGGAVTDFMASTLINSVDYYYMQDKNNLNASNLISISTNLNGI